MSKKENILMKFLRERNIKVNMSKTYFAKKYTLLVEFRDLDVLCNCLFSLTPKAKVGDMYPIVCGLWSGYLTILFPEDDSKIFKTIDEYYNLIKDNEQ